MAHEFIEFEDVSEKLHWCSEQLGPDLKSNNQWCWDFGYTHCSIVIAIADDENCMAYRLRWH